jgi:D-threo-aldose 1-dehydrogenase
MKIPANEFRAIGSTGLLVPPVMFSSAPLGDEDRVIPDQTKLAICAEWFRHVEPPLFIDAVVGDDSSTAALRFLGQALRRFEISPDETIINARLQWNHGADRESTANNWVRRAWEHACRALGDNLWPQLVSIDAPGAVAPLDALADMKAAGHVKGIGVAVSDWRALEEISDALPLDFVMLNGCFTVMRHPPELLDYLAVLANRNAAIILADVFHGDFLAGDTQFEGRAVDDVNPADKPLLAWRKSFTALCHGHGVAPKHACIQFALRAPGVVAVLVSTSHPDRVAGTVEWAQTAVPCALWDSMKEEGLLDAAYPFVG